MSSPASPWPRRRFGPWAAALAAVHAVAVWMMVESRLTVASVNPSTQVAWTAIRPVAAPTRVARAVPASKSPPIRRIEVPADLGAAGPADPSFGEKTSPTPPGAAGPPSAAPPLDLRLPRDSTDRAGAPTPAEEAMRDPRSNTLRLTPGERLQLAFGQVECIAWQRMPDGSIYRGPGHLRRAPDVAPRPDGTRVMECAR